MRCIDCNNYQYLYGTHYCNANPKRPKRIVHCDELKDVFCDKINEPIEKLMEYIRGNKCS